MRRLILPLVILLAGCGIPFTQKAFETTPEGAYLKQVMSWAAAKDYAAIEGALDLEIRNRTHVREELEKMAAYIPAGSPTSIEFIGWNETIGARDRSVSLLAEYGYGPDRWLLVKVIVRGNDVNLRLWGFHVQAMKKSLREANRFTFAGKGWLHYFVVAAAVFTVGLSVYALVLCARTKGLRRKWLWIIFILFGIGAFSLNWTTGELKVKVLQFYLFGAAAIRSGFVGPWIITFCIPVGALVFLYKRRKAAVRAPALPPVIGS